MIKKLLSCSLALIVITMLITFVHSAITVNQSISLLDEPQQNTHVQKHIILIAQERDNPFWRRIEQGALAAAQADDILLQYMGPNISNTAEQEELLQKAIDYSPDGIIVQGMNTERYHELIAKAFNQHIPVITVDTDSPNSERIAYIGTDHVAAGKQLGRLILSNYTSLTVIGIIIGSAQSENQLLRLQALKEQLELSPLIQIVDVGASNISKIEAAKQTVEMIKQYPTINIMIGLSGLDGIGITEGLEALNRKDIDVYGFDNLSITEQLVKQSDIKATIIQQPEQIGSQAIVTLLKYFNHENFDEKQYISTTILESP